MQITIREPGSAITHCIGMLLSVICAVPLLQKAQESQIPMAVTAMAIFAVAMILLYSASTIYHSVNVKDNVLKVFRKLDHMMIFVLIAGTYTPVCLIALNHKKGYTLLALVWGIAIAGMIIKACWITCPKWFSSIMYIAMGWVCLLVLPDLAKNSAAFAWLLAGGVLYTVGGVIYGIKFKQFDNIHKYFGSHEIFHLFVMAGTACHFVYMYCYLV